MTKADIASLVAEKGLTKKQAMRPDFAEVDLAAEILLAAQDAQWGPTQHQGRLHDRASYRYFWELLQRAKATGMRLPTEAQSRFFA